MNLNHFARISALNAEVKAVQATITAMVAYNRQHPETPYVEQAFLNQAEELRLLAARLYDLARECDDD